MGGNGGIPETAIDPVEGKDRSGDAGTAAPSIKDATSRRRMLSAAKSAGALTLSILIGLSLWEVVARIADNPLIIVAPSEVAERIFVLVSTGALWPHIVASTSAFMYGFAAALVLGIALGLVLSETELLRTMLDPWLDAMYATPMIVFAPIFIVSMGIGVTSKAAVVFLVSFFPIVITTVTGARLVEPKLLDMGRAFGFSRTQITYKIRAPFALPTIIAGLRVASARGLVGVVVAEMFGSRAGLGYLIVASNQNFDTVGMFSGGVVLIVFGVLINAFFRWLERYLAPWKVSHK